MDSTLNEVVIKSFTSGPIDSHAPLARRLIIRNLSKFLFHFSPWWVSIQSQAPHTVTLTKEVERWVRILMKISLGRVAGRYSVLRCLPRVTSSNELNLHRMSEFKCGGEVVSGGRVEPGT